MTRRVESETLGEAQVGGPHFSRGQAKTAGRHLAVQIPLWPPRLRRPNGLLGERRMLPEILNISDEPSGVRNGTPWADDMPSPFFPDPAQAIGEASSVRPPPDGLLAYYISLRLAARGLSSSGTSRSKGATADSPHQVMSQKADAKLGCCCHAPPGADARRNLGRCPLPRRPSFDLLLTA